MKTQYYLKITVILLALLQPMLILIFLEDIESISMSWGTKLQPIFILTNASTSFYFFHIKEWRLEAILLMLLTAFSVDLFETVHNLIALSFFLSCFFSLRKDKYSKYLYLLSIPVFLLYNLFWAEFLAISVLCYYHLRLLLRVHRVI